MRTSRVALWITALTALVLCAEPKTGWVCIAPVLAKPLPTSAPNLECSSEKLSLKVDEKTMPWPMKQSVKVEGLDTAVQHRVIVLCNGKPQQSFGFRFSEFETKELCLFINGFYKTVQLWSDKRCPWCKCRQE